VSNRIFGYLQKTSLVFNGCIDDAITNQLLLVPHKLLHKSTSKHKCVHLIWRTWKNAFNNLFGIVLAVATASTLRWPLARQSARQSSPMFTASPSCTVWDLGAGGGQAIQRGTVGRKVVDTDGSAVVTEGRAFRSRCSPNVVYHVIHGITSEERCECILCFPRGDLDGVWNNKGGGLLLQCDDIVSRNDKLHTRP
jgi:hypothetical protein